MSCKKQFDRSADFYAAEFSLLVLSHVEHVCSDYHNHRHCDKFRSAILFFPLENPLQTPVTAERGGGNRSCRTYLRSSWLHASIERSKDVGCYNRLRRSSTRFGTSGWSSAVLISLVVEREVSIVHLQVGSLRSRSRSIDPLLFVDNRSRSSRRSAVELFKRVFNRPTRRSSGSTVRPPWTMPCASTRRGHTRWCRSASTILSVAMVWSSSFDMPVSN